MPALDEPIDIDAAKASMDAAFRTEVKQQPAKQAVTPTPEPKVEPQKPPQAQDHTPKGLRDALEARNRELKELQAKLAEYEPRLKEVDTFKSDFEKTKAERDALAGERDEYKKLQSVAALEQSPDFQKKYVQGSEMLRNRLQQLAEMAGVAPAELFAAASKTGKDRYSSLDELIDGAPKSLQGKLLSTIDEMDNLAASRQEELSKAHELMQQRVQEHESNDRRTREERARIRDEAWSSAVAKLGKDTGLSESEIHSAFDFIKSNKDASRAAEITLKGHAYDKLATELASLRAEVRAYQDGTPRVGAGARNSHGADADLDKMPLAQRMNELAKRQLR